MPEPGDFRAPLRATKFARDERVLHLHLRTPAEPQQSMTKALASLASDGIGNGYTVIDWLPLYMHRGGSDAVRDALLRAATALRPTLVFMQLQNGDVVSPETVKRLRGLCADDAVIVHWTGDVTGQFGDADSHWTCALARECDVMLYSCMTHVRQHQAKGSVNAAYLQIGYDEDRYSLGPDHAYGRSFDVAYLGNRYDPSKMKPSVEHDNDADLRTECAQFVERRFGKRAGVFGAGWPRGPIDAGLSADVYRRSHLALSVSYASTLERYSSDRLLRALACGTPTLCKSFVGHESWGLKHKENVLLFDDVEDFGKLAAIWTSPNKAGDLRPIGKAGAALAKEHHTWDVRMRELAVIVAAARGVALETERPW